MYSTNPVADASAYFTALYKEAEEQEMEQIERERQDLAIVRSINQHDKINYKTLLTVFAALKAKMASDGFSSIECAAIDDAQNFICGDV